jgi:hypothetical protein
LDSCSLEATLFHEPFTVSSARYWPYPIKFPSSHLIQPSMSG